MSDTRKDSTQAFVQLLVNFLETENKLTDIAYNSDQLYNLINDGYGLKTDFMSTSDQYPKYLTTMKVIDTLSKYNLLRIYSTVETGDDTVLKLINNEKILGYKSITDAFNDTDIYLDKSIQDNFFTLFKNLIQSGDYSEFLLDYEDVDYTYNLFNKVPYDVKYTLTTSKPTHWYDSTSKITPQDLLEIDFKPKLNTWYRHTGNYSSCFQTNGLYYYGISRYYAYFTYNTSLTMYVVVNNASTEWAADTYYSFDLITPKIFNESYYKLLLMYLTLNVNYSNIINLTAPFYELLDTTKYDFSNDRLFNELQTYFNSNSAAFCKKFTKFILIYNYNIGNPSNALIELVTPYAVNGINSILSLIESKLSDKNDLVFDSFILLFSILMHQFISSFILEKYDAYNNNYEKTTELTIVPTYSLDATTKLDNVESKIKEYMEDYSAIAIKEFMCLLYFYRSKAKKFLNTIPYISRLFVDTVISTDYSIDGLSIADIQNNLKTNSSTTDGALLNNVNEIFDTFNNILKDDKKIADNTIIFNSLPENLHKIVKNIFIKLITQHNTIEVAFYNIICSFIEDLFTTDTTEFDNIITSILTGIFNKLRSIGQIQFDYNYLLNKKFDEWYLKTAFRSIINPAKLTRKITETIQSVDSLLNKTTVDEIYSMNTNAATFNHYYNKTNVNISTGTVGEPIVTKSSISTKSVFNDLLNDMESFFYNILDYSGGITFSNVISSTSIDTIIDSRFIETVFKSEIFAEKSENYISAFIAAYNKVLKSKIETNLYTYTSVLYLASADVTTLVDQSLTNMENIDISFSVTEGTTTKTYTFTTSGDTITDKTAMANELVKDFNEVVSTGLSNFANNVRLYVRGNPDKILKFTDNLIFSAVNKNIIKNQLSYYLNTGIRF